jgi:hypothetical protein
MIDYIHIKHYGVQTASHSSRRREDHNSKIDL